MMVDCRDCIHFEACLKKIKRTKKFSETAPDEYFSHDDGCIYFINAADIVPKSEVDRLEKEVRLLTENSISAKYPCCVSTSKGLILTKSLEEYDKLLADIASEVAREIFEEIGKMIKKLRYDADYSIFDMQRDFAELKKKYT
jgi:hypothetical protein